MLPDRVDLACTVAFEDDFLALFAAGRDDPKAIAAQGFQARHLVRRCPGIGVDPGEPASPWHEHEFARPGLPVIDAREFSEVDTFDRIERLGFAARLDQRRDPFGEVLLRPLLEAGVNVDLCPRTDRLTTLALVTLIGGIAPGSFVVWAVPP